MSVLSCWVSQVPCLLQWLILWSLLDDLNCLPCLTLSGGWVHSWCCGHFLASMQPVGRTPWFETIRPFDLSCDLFLASSFSVCAGVKVRFSTMPGWRASSPPLKVPSPGLYILSKSCLRFFSSVPGFSVLGFFFFHVSFIIFYLFQLGLKYVENNLLAPERGPQGPCVSTPGSLCLHQWVGQHIGMR